MDGSTTGGTTTQQGPTEKLSFVRLGIVVLTNGGEPGRLLTSAAALRAVDVYLGAPVRDWSAELRDVYRTQVARDSVDAEKEKAKRATGTKASLAFDRYAGTYASVMYGDVTVALENGALVSSRGPISAGTSCRGACS